MHLCILFRLVWEHFNIKNHLNCDFFCIIAVWVLTIGGRGGKRVIKILEEIPQKLGYFKNPYLLCPQSSDPRPSMVLTPIKCHLSFLPGCITHLRSLALPSRTPWLSWTRSRKRSTTLRPLRARSSRKSWSRSWERTAVYICCRRWQRYSLGSLTPWVQDGVWRRCPSSSSAPMTRVDVERFFSSYKHILDDHTHKLLEETSRMMFAILSMPGNNKMCEKIHLLNIWKTNFAT